MSLTILLDSLFEIAEPGERLAALAIASNKILALLLDAFALELSGRFDDPDKFDASNIDIVSECIIDFMDDLRINEFSTLPELAAAVEAEISGREVVEYKKITIPAMDNHRGIHTVSYIVPWLCIHCGQKRGEIKPTKSYDGSLSMIVDGWRNDCRHIEYYGDVRQYYKDNSHLIKTHADTVTNKLANGEHLRRISQ